MRLILSLFLISSSVFASSWRELEVHKKYKLKQSFQLKQYERSGSLLDISKGENLVLKKKTPFVIAGVVQYIFDYLPCPGPQMETEMEIIPVQETLPVIEVEALLEPGCELNIYIENKDLLTKSFLD